MAGITAQGLEIKRLDEVIEDRIDSARNFFGNDAKTTVNDVLGRTLRVHSISESDLWELAEAVYQSFNPAYATGVALDRIVAYGRLTRLEAAPSTVSLLATGNYQTVIPTGSYVDSSTSNNRFVTTESLTLNTTSISGATVQVIVSQDSINYSVTLGANTFTYTSGTGETLAQIATGIANEIDASSNYNASVVNAEQVMVGFTSVYVPANISVTDNISIVKIKKFVRAESEEIGPVVQLEGTLDTISSPVSGWDSVTNPSAATVGRYRETDEELRIRFQNTKELNAQGTIDAIFANLNNVEGVDSVQVYENTTEAADANGLPSKSFSSIVKGGNEQTIADTIWSVKPAGIATHGNTTVSIVDTQGVSHNISFSRPVNIDVYIDLTVSAAENESIPADVEMQILDALETYFENNFVVGKDVVYSRLYTPINSISGVQVDSLTIGTSPSPTGTSNIVIDFDEIANFSRNNVNITVN